MVVARAEIDFVEPIYDGGRFVDIETTVEKIGNSSFTMHFVISGAGKIFAHVRTVQVAVSMETKKSRPLNDKEREFLSRYLESN
jgi:acyl-CoA thioester hydrolase